MNNGTLCTSIALADRLIDEGVDPYIGSVGDAYDNSLVESQIGLYKAELDPSRRGSSS